MTDTRRKNWTSLERTYLGCVLDLKTARGQCRADLARLKKHLETVLGKRTQEIEDYQSLAGEIVKDMLDTRAQCVN